MGEKGRKTFEFRMSKKVAELTQVVHMLFTRNHEKEVEIEALKDAYEYEIELVIKDAKSNIENLKSKILELQQRKSLDSDRLKLHYEQLIGEREAEWKKRFEVCESHLQTEKQECQTARDLLINAQMDIEKLRNGQGELAKKLDEIASKNKEIERLKLTLAQTDKTLKEKEYKSCNIISDLQQACDKSQKEINTLKEKNEMLQRTKDECFYRIKQLEAESRNLRNKVKTPPGSSRSRPERPDYKHLSNASFLDYNEEMERLRRQVEMYKNELRNREDNFNRMFTDKQPIVVERRANRLSSSNKLQQVFQVEQAQSLPMPRFNKEKTMPTYSQSSYTDEDRTSPSLRSHKSSSAGSARLPNLGMDQKNRIARMLKPRPPPREVLSGKSLRESLM